MNKLYRILLSMVAAASLASCTPSAVAAHNQSATWVTGYPRGATSWSCALNSLAATLTECQAIPSTGLRHYVTDISVGTTTTTAGDYAIRTGTGANCGTATAQLYPKSGSGADRFKAPIASNGMNLLSFTLPLEATAGHAICVIGKATDTINIQIHGYTIL
jgi:hypothetical protein